MTDRARVIVFVLPILVILAATPASAETYTGRKPRRQFITVSYDTFSTQPLHFEKYPLEALAGAEVAAAQFQTYDYVTRNGSILIDVLEFTKRGHGASVTVYPFGASVGATLALRGTVQELPDVRIAFSGVGAPQQYYLSGARAYDAGAALFMADRSSGWGLGSYAFLGGGVGRIRSSLSDGDRFFAEGGGGMNSGPFGVELAVKFAWNHLTEPVDHHFVTVPITLRGTLSF
jgi:hypothetical protein